MENTMKEKIETLVKTEKVGNVTIELLINNALNKICVRHWHNERRALARCDWWGPQDMTSAEFKFECLIRGFSRTI